MTPYFCSLFMVTIIFSSAFSEDTPPSVINFVESNTDCKVHYNLGWPNHGRRIDEVTDYKIIKSISEIFYPITNKPIDNAVQLDKNMAPLADGYQLTFYISFISSKGKRSYTGWFKFIPKPDRLDYEKIGILVTESGSESTLDCQDLIKFIDRFLSIIKDETKNGSLLNP